MHTGANRARFQVDEGVAVDEENATESELHGVVQFV